MPEVFVDIDYDTSGNLLGVPQSNPCTPEGIKAKVSSMLNKLETTNKDGKAFKLPGLDRHFTICLHSDMPTALDNVQAARSAIDEWKAAGGK